jgi:hypothetical protein
LVIQGGLAVGRMTQQDFRTAPRRILRDLEAHGEAPILVMKGVLGDPQVRFYMGLGDLILERRVILQERQGSFWATQNLKSKWTS